jgi:sporulation protein YlmC with PRC-barrel domain
MKSTITALFFTMALFMGTALSAETPGTTQDPAQRGDQKRGFTGTPGTPEQRPPLAGERQQDQAGQQERQTGVFQEDMIPGMHRAENLMGKNVKDQQGNDLGSINDLIVSENGQVEFIVMSRGGVIGVGADQVAVPWEAANLQRGADDELMASITEEQLEGAPTFDNYAQFQDQQFEQEVHSYFGTEPRSDQVTSPGMQQDTQMNRPYQKPGTAN